MSAAKINISRCIILAAILSQIVNVSLGQTNVPNQEITSRADEYLSTLTKLERFSGSVLIARDGKVLLSKGYGMANLEHDVLNTPQTKFRTASLGKTFTSASVLMLQEQGKLKVEDPICKYVPDCPSAWQPITIHHLLTHTSGIPDLTAVPNFRKTATLPSTVLETIARFKNKPLEFNPGERYSYSNSGYILLGYIIEIVSGKSYAAFLRETIFTPLLMTDTGYDNYDLVLRHRASGYARRDESLVNAPYIDMSIPFAAGGLYSTVENLYLWDQALYTQKLLSEKSLAGMFTPLKGGYGYGWHIDRQFDRNSVSHGGGINGFSTNLVRFPGDKICIIVLSNVEMTPVGPISRDLAAIVFGEKYQLPTMRVAIKVDPKIYDAYVGRYDRGGDRFLTITREGDRLMGEAVGRKSELFPESETQFFLKVADTQVTFVKDEKGKIPYLILREGGRDRQLKRVQ